MRSARLLLTLDAVGGVWRYTMDLAKALTETGHEVMLAGLGPEPDAGQRAEAARIAPLAWGPCPLDWMVDGPEALAGVGPWLDATARRHGATHLVLSLPSQAADLPRRSSRRVFSVCHSCLATWFDAVEHAPVPPALDWHPQLTARGLTRSDLVIAPTRSHAAAVERLYHPGQPLRVVPNASGPRPRATARRDTVVAAGRWWDKGKNAGLLDAAAEGLVWPVEMLGRTEGPDGSCARLSHARPLGVQSHAATQEAIATAGLFVAPSLYEPFGLAVLEAACSATPLVLADIPSFRENWDGAALFFDPHSAGALAGTLRRAIADAELRRRLGTAAFARADGFTPEAQMAAMDSLLWSDPAAEAA